MVQIRRDGVLETQPVSAAALPLPAGASTESTLAAARGDIALARSDLDTLVTTEAASKADLDVIRTDTDLLVAANNATLQVTKRIDNQTVAGVVFIGTAPAGTAESSSGWTIKRIDLFGGVRRVMITGAGAAVYANRITASYS